MKKDIQISAVIYVLILLADCSPKKISSEIMAHNDKPFIQDYSIKYIVSDENVKLYKVVSDRNGYIQILSSEGLLRPANGQFLFPGRLVDDFHYRPTSDREISGIGIYRDQLVYIDDKAVFSNAWAGELYSKHTLDSAKNLAGGNDFTFLITDGKRLVLLRNSQTLWEADFPEEVRRIKFDEENNQFWILGKETISVFSPVKMEIEKIISKDNLTCIEVFSGKLIAGTTDGYFELDTRTRKPAGNVRKRLPCTRN